MQQPAGSVGPPSHEVTLQRFKLLHLVQQVAKADVDELIRTVGIEALTFRGTGMRRALAEAGVGSQSVLAQHHVDNPYVEHRAHHRHVYREFTSDSRPQRASRSAAHQGPAVPHHHHHPYSRRYDVDPFNDPYHRPSRGDYYSSARDVTREEEEAYHHRDNQGRPRAHRRGQQGHDGDGDRRHLVSTPERTRRPTHAAGTKGGPPPPATPNNAEATDGENRPIDDTTGHRHEQPRDAPRRNNASTAAAHVDARRDPPVGEARTAPGPHPVAQTMPPSAEAATCAVPKEIIQLAGQILARTSGRGSRGGSLQATPHKGASPAAPSTQSVAVEAQLHTDATSVGVGRSPTDATRPQSDAHRTALPHVPQRWEAGDRRDAGTGGDPQRQHMEDAAVEAAAPQQSVSTNTPPPKHASTVTQTRYDADGNASNAPPTLRLSEGSETKDAPYYAQGSHRHAQPPRWAVDAMHALDTILEEQRCIEQRAHRVHSTNGGGGDVASGRGNAAAQLHPPARGGWDDIVEDPDSRDHMEIARAARRVDAMMEEEDALESQARSQDPPSVPSNETRIRRAQRKTLPPAVVEKLLAFRKDEVECIRYNERLWNTSNVSQFTFADRLTTSLLEDLFEEVIQEVGGVLDEYVEGLADHELQ